METLEYTLIREIHATAEHRVSGEGNYLRSFHMLLEAPIEDLLIRVGGGSGWETPFTRYWECPRVH